MGYRKIPNLYKDQRFLFYADYGIAAECYAMEKIHGTSAHVGVNEKGVHYHHGGADRASFLKIFENTDIEERLKELWDGLGDPIVVYGEAYGGKMQRMSDTYGPELKFVAFEVKVGETWLTVPEAHRICQNLGIEFVDYVKIPLTLEALNQERDRESVQAIRNGMGPGKVREGIIIRPLKEVEVNGERLITKHKCAAFSEMKTPREVDPGKLKVLSDAREVAEEWVTEMRLDHVIDKVLQSETPDLKFTRRIIDGMIEDVKVEGAGEIEFSKEVFAAIGRRAASLFKKKVTEIKT